MNIISGNLPQKINNVEIKTDFRTWLSFQRDVVQCKTEIELIRCFKAVFAVDVKVTRANINIFMESIKDFIGGARSYTNPNYKGKSTKEKNVISYDIELDSNYIFSAFLEQYGINLLKCDLHYYEFIALFDCLRADTLFKRIVEIRDTNLAEIKDKKSKENMRDLQNLFKIPSVEEQQHFTPEFLEKWSL